MPKDMLQVMYFLDCAVTLMSGQRFIDHTRPVFKFVLHSLCDEVFYFFWVGIKIIELHVFGLVEVGIIILFTRLIIFVPFLLIAMFHDAIRDYINLQLVFTILNLLVQLFIRSSTLDSFL